MCINIWSTKNQLGYRLILASNRDEFFHRPSSPASWHSFEKNHHNSHAIPSPLPFSSKTLFQLNFNEIPSDNHQDNNSNHGEILSGRDLIAGGTWLGINKTNGKFGFLTNIAPLLDVHKENDEDEESNQDSSRSDWSRGNLIRDFLQSEGGVEEYIATLKSSQSIKKNRGFNLVIGQLGKISGEEDKFGFFSNRDPVANYDSMPKNQDCKDSVHGISNGIAAQSPIWPKVSLGINLMENVLKYQVQPNDNSSEIDTSKLEEDLFNLLSQTDDTTDYGPQNILIRPHHRPSSCDTEKSYQTWYGTRTQTIVLVSRATPTRVTFIERDAFLIELDDQPGFNLGKPVWLGNDPSRWRRFEFELSS